MDNSVNNQAGGPKPVTKGLQILTEIPSSLRTLARLVVRGFYPIEDALVIDMLVRYPCMREDDVSALLKFDKKHLRARMDLLKKDKLVQVHTCVNIIALNAKLIKNVNGQNINFIQLIKEFFCTGETAY